MALIKIYCPQCGRILGDTEQSIDANINCRGCKTTQHIVMEVKSISDYYELNKEAHDQPQQHRRH